MAVGIGVTSIRRQDTGAADFGRADQPLYVAKRRGRNRLPLFGASQGSQALESVVTLAPEVEWL